MKPRKRSVELFGKPTSFTLEPEYWEALRVMCKAEDVALYRMIERIAEQKSYKNLSSCIRVCVLSWALDKASSSWQPAA